MRTGNIDSDFQRVVTVIAAPPKDEPIHDMSELTNLLVIITDVVPEKVLGGL